MKIYPKILLTVLSMIIITGLGAFAITTMLSRQALLNQTQELLSAELNRAINIVTTYDELLAQYGLGNVPASVRQAQFDVATELRQVIIGDNGFILAMDEQGVIVSGSDATQIGLTILQEPWFQSIQSNQAGGQKIDFQGITYLAEYQYFPDWGWYVMAVVPESEVLQPIRQALNLGMMLMVLVSGLVLIPLTWIVRRILNPLQLVSDGAARIGQGDYEVQIPATSKDEVGTLAVVFNKTAHQIKEHIRALRESEERYAALFTHAADGIFISDLDGNYIDVNESGCRMLGYTRAKILQMNVSDLVTPEFNPEPIRFDELRAGQIVVTQRLLRHHDGFDIPVEISAKKIDSDRLQAIVRDITERKQAELALSEAQKQLTLAVRSGNVGLWDWDLLTNKVYYSPEWKHQLGHEDHEILNDFSEWESRVHPDDLERATQTVNTYLEKPYPNYQNEFRMRHKDGSYRWILAQASPLYDDGKPTRMMGSHIDITERKRAEDTLRASESKYRSLFENMQEGSVLGEIILDDQGKVVDFRFLDANAAYERHTGMNPKDILGRTIQEVQPDVDTRQIEIYGKVALTGDPHIFEYYSGAYQRHFRVQAFSPQHGRFATVFEDISVRKQAERELLQLNRLYAMISQVNQMIVRVNDQQELYQTICNIMVEYGGFSLASIGMLNGTSGEIRPVAVNGLDLTNWPFPTANINDGESKDGLVATAIRTSKVIISENLYADQRLGHIQDVIHQFGYHSAAAVPLQLNGQCIGALSIASAEAGLFKDQREIQLLEELQLDISFALDKMQAAEEHRQAEEALKYEEMLLRHVIDTSPAVIFVKDRDSTILLANRTMASFYNLTVKEVTGRRQSDLHREFGALQEDIEQWLADDRAVIDSGVSKHIVETGTDSNHQIHWFETTKSQIDIGNDRLGILVFSEDITERKQAQLELENRERYFRALIENSSDGIAIISEHGRIIYQSPAAFRILGFPLDELTGQDVFEFVHPDDQSKSVGLFAQLIENPGKPVSTQVRFRHKDGTWRWAEPVGTNLLADPSVHGIVVNFRDITESKFANDALREQQERQQKILDAIFVFVGLFSLEGVILEANRAPIEATGLRAEDVIGKPFADLPPWAHSETARTQVREAIRRAALGETVREDLLILLPNNQFATIDSIFVPLRDSSGKIFQVVGSGVDITARKQAELALQAAEQDYRAIFENAPLGIFQSTPEGRFQKANPAMAKMYGYASPEELVQSISSIAKQIHLEEASRQEFVDKIKEFGEVVEFERLNRRKDETVIWTSTNAHVVRDDSNQIMYYEGFIRDITEYKRSEERRVILYETLREISKHLQQDAIVRTAVDTIVRLSRWASVVISLADPNGQTWTPRAGGGPLVGKLSRHRPISQGITGRVYRTGDTQLVADVLADPDFFTVEDISTPIRSELAVPIKHGSEVLGVLNIESEALNAFTSWDVSLAESLADAMALALEKAHLYDTSQQEIAERKRAEDALLRQTKRLKTLREIDTAILSADSVENIIRVALNHVRELIDCDRAVVALIDEETNDVVVFNVSTVRETSVTEGTRVPFVLLQDMAPTLLKDQPVLITDLAKAQNLPFLFQTLRDEGLRSVCVLPLFSQSNLMGAFNVSSKTPGFFDEEKVNLGREVANQVAIGITQMGLIKDLQHLNANLEQRVQERTRELEEANKELDAFSYSVSHDLRSPLRAVNGFSQILLENYLSQIPQEAQHYLEQVRNGSERMAQLIDDLLQLSRVSRKVIRKERVDLSALVYSIVDDLKYHAPDREVEIMIAENLITWGDPGLLRISVENLLNNAWKYTSKRQQAQIEFGSFVQEDDMSVFFVRDNGVGFDMAYADKLFGAFQRLHSVTDFEGTGIGLATVQRIVHRHGGRVWAEAEPDQGATFYFTIA